jgi:thiol-disulfide isomerase/thioredoxin
MRRPWSLSVLLLPAIVLASSGDDLVGAVRTALAYNNIPLAEKEIATYRARSGATPAVLEAISWVGRGALAAGSMEKADACAVETRRFVLEVLKKRPLDADPHLPLALGNSIEIQAQVMTAQGRRAEAITFLTQERQTWARTSIAPRIQKNINVLTLEGKPAPALAESPWLGARPPTLASLRGHPVLLFFWAHWCSDCKREALDIANLAAEYRAQGLVVIGPTQHYGYVAQGQEAVPQQELQYIDLVRRQFYAALGNMPVPVSEDAFRVYGASTTPTLVLIDRKGIVRMYHPGAMPYGELAAQLQSVLKRP